MFVIDTHCDSVETLEHGAPCIANTYNMGEKHLQFTAMFNDRPGLSPEECWQLLRKMAANIQQQAALFPDKLALCRDMHTAQEAVNSGKKAMILSMEGACALDGKPERLEEMAEAGVRIISLTWNQNNRYGCANGYNGTPEDIGLTREGRQLVEECGRRGILIDVSHASDNTIRGILQYSSLPVIATHSNFRSLTNHPRNLPDDLAKDIYASGGVIGLNLCTAFIGGADLALLLPHLDWALENLGEDAIGFGFDIDGIDEYPAPLSMEAPIHEQVLEFLRQHGYSGQLLKKLAHSNWQKLLQKVMP